MQRDTLTGEQIVHAAIPFLDAEGIEGLSMRRLAHRLGSAATAVYWHVKSKDTLVVLAADAVWGEIELLDLSLVDWRTGATTMAEPVDRALPAFLEAMRCHDGGGWITYRPLARGCRRADLVEAMQAFLAAYLKLVRADVDRRLAELERNHDYLPRECQRQ